MQARTWNALVLAGGMAGLLLAGAARAGEPAAAAKSGPLHGVDAMREPLAGLGAFLSNASFKLRRGIGGVGSTDGAFSIQDCCAVNVEKMRGFLDVLSRERTDLQRDFERSRNAMGIEKLDALSASLRVYEEGYKLLLAARRPDQATMVLDGLLKSHQALEAAHTELAACCSPAEK